MTGTILGRGTLLNLWQQWLHHPERLWFREAFFQVHFWAGALVAPYVTFMSLSGAALVFRNHVEGLFSMAWLARLHGELLSGNLGRIVNGMGGICTILVCITGAGIWWPGIAHWKRSLRVSWASHFPRISWDLHSALGFWCFPFVALWGISGVYLALPKLFNVLFVVDPRDRYADPILFWLSQLHFGRFDLLSEIVWAVVGLVPAVLAFTGAFICCRRVFFKKPSNPKMASG